MAKEEKTLLTCATKLVSMLVLGARIQKVVLGNVCAAWLGALKELQCASSPLPDVGWMEFDIMKDMQGMKNFKILWTKLMVLARHYVLQNHTTNRKTK